MKYPPLLIASSTTTDTTGALLIVTIVVLVLFLYSLFRFAEPFYAHFFKRPLYVHFYPFPEQLTNEQLFILQSEFSFYQKLPPRQQSYFEHRVKQFISKYQFIGQNGQEITDEVKVLIAATSVMLTFGMRDYLYTVFDKIVVFPTRYYSAGTQSYHKGEFNPALKAIVFSWEDFMAGYKYSSDNLNLGLHEFTHALHFQSSKKNGVSAVIFSDMFRKIMQEVNYPSNREKILTSGYFRDYAYTNQYEFLAVLLEHFFETPETFKAHFPVLYDNVQKMINFKDYSR